LKLPALQSISTKAEQRASFVSCDEKFKRLKNIEIYKLLKKDVKESNRLKKRKLSEEGIERYNGKNTIDKTLSDRDIFLLTVYWRKHDH
jgi:hypothetical protein